MRISTPLGQVFAEHLDRPLIPDLGGLRLLLLRTEWLVKLHSLHVGFMIDFDIVGVLNQVGDRAVGHALAVVGCILQVHQVLNKITRLLTIALSCQNASASASLESSAYRGVLKLLTAVCLATIMPEFNSDVNAS